MLATLSTTVFLLSGCSTAQQPTKEVETTESLQTMQDQINTMQGSLNNYLSSPVASKYELLDEDSLKPVYTETGSSIILQIEAHDNQSYTEISPLFVFYDAEGNILSYSNAYFSNVYPSIKYYANVTFSSTGDSFTYDHFEVQYRAILAKENELPKNMADQLAVTSNVGSSGGVLAKFANNSTQNIDYVNSYVLFYSGGSLIGCSESGVYDLVAGSYGIAEYSNPYDMYFNEVPFDDYKLIVTSAYQSFDTFQPETPR